MILPSNPGALNSRTHPSRGHCLLKPGKALGNGLIARGCPLVQVGVPGLVGLIHQPGKSLKAHTVLAGPLALCAAGLLLFPLPIGPTGTLLPVAELGLPPLPVLSPHPSPLRSGPVPLLGPGDGGTEPGQPAANALAQRGPPPVDGLARAPQRGGHAAVGVPADPATRAGGGHYRIPARIDAPPWKMLPQKA